MSAVSVPRAAIVSGAAQGLGRAIARRFAGDGYSVVLADVNVAKAQNVVAEIEAAGGVAVAVETDISDEPSTIRLAAAALERFGRIDVLVANAAMRATTRRPFWELGLDEWDRFMAVNVRGLLLSMRAVLPAMREQHGGAIVTISSSGVLAGVGNQLQYAATKGAVIAMTRSAARDLGPLNVRVNAVLPGSLETEIPRSGAQLDPAERTASRSAQIIQREQTPDDVVGVVAFLASDDARFMTGQSVNVDGGRSFL